VAGMPWHPPTRGDGLTVLITIAPYRET
jgi:hypothetical protein